MNSGLLYLDAGDVLIATKAVEQWSPTDFPRHDAEIVVGLLLAGRDRTDALLNRWKARLGNMETMSMEAQDIEAGESIFFRKQNEIHELISVEPTALEGLEGFICFTFETFALDVSPDETFDVVTST